MPCLVQVAYISGYVCQRLTETGAVQCKECFGALLNHDDPNPPGEVLELVNVRDNGRLLVHPRQPTR